MNAAEFARRMNQTTTPHEVEQLVNELHDQHDPRTATQIVNAALPMVTPIDERPALGRPESIQGGAA